jgi:hypothetical protein
MPDEIANAIASGSATRPTVTPATASAANRRAVVVLEGENRRGDEAGL